MRQLYLFFCFVVVAIFGESKEVPMKNYTIVERPAMKLIGIECRTSNDPERGPKDIGELWRRFYHEYVISKIPSKESNDIVAYYCDYDGDYTEPYTLVIGCKVTSVDVVPDGMVVREIPARTYALFSAQGEFPQAVGETWFEIWDTDLERTYAGDFEYYGEKFVSGDPREVEICIAIEK